MDDQDGVRGQEHVEADLAEADVGVARVDEPCTRSSTSPGLLAACCMRSDGLKASVCAGCPATLCRHRERQC